MAKDPRDRLGAGKKHSKNGMKALKEHSFFKGMKFKNLYKKNPKVPKKLIGKVNRDFVREEKDEFDEEDLKETDGEKVIESLKPAKIFKTFSKTDKLSYFDSDSTKSGPRDYSKMSSTKL